jgi:hypothetical protein
VRRNVAILALLSLQALVAGLSLWFHTRARVSILDAFHAYDTAIPPFTAVALSTWLIPGALAAAGLLDLAAVALPLRRSRRAGLAATGLFVSSTALIFAVWAAFAPLFRP